MPAPDPSGTVVAVAPTSTVVASVDARVDEWVTVQVQNMDATQTFTGYVERRVSSLLAFLAFLACGPAVDLGPIRADAGDPCPGPNLVACDGPCVVRCGPDGGVWTVRTCNPKCGVEWRAVGND